MLSVGIIGASGYTGAELLRLLSGHPEFELAWVSGDTAAGSRVDETYPSLAAAYRGLTYRTYAPADADGLDVVFLCLPHGKSQELVPDLRNRAKRVVDLAADFRLKDPALYPQWYGEAHHCPEFLAESVYGLPELYREDHHGATFVASPGCYVTTAALALAPLVHRGLVEPTGIVVDAASGVSGAGKAPKANTHFNSVDEDFSAYGLLTHRHTPEIEQALGHGAQVLFTPHLAPMNRGILASCYARPTRSQSTEQLLAEYRDFYAGEPFVVVTDGSPSTKATLGTNTCHITVRRDDRTGWVLAIAALDNLCKGASGQAVQSANLICGLPEATGLPTAGLYP